MGFVCPLDQSGVWSPQCLEKGCPLWPVGMTDTDASRSPRSTIWRSDAGDTTADGFASEDQPLFGEYPSPARFTGPIVSSRSSGLTAESGCAHAIVWRSPQRHFAM